MALATGLLGRRDELLLAPPLPVKVDIRCKRQANGSRDRSQVVNNPIQWSTNIDLRCSRQHRPRASLVPDGIGRVSSLEEPMRLPEKLPTILHLTDS